MNHEIILTDEQETAAQYYADLHKITIEEMIVRDYIDGNLVLAYDEVQKTESKAKYEALPSESKAVVDAARADQDAQLAALIDLERKKVKL